MFLHNTPSMCAYEAALDWKQSLSRPLVLMATWGSVISLSEPHGFCP